MRTRRVSRDERGQGDHNPGERGQDERAQSERPQAEPVHEARRNDERRAPAEKRENRWVGPTPADPFGGGSFDIFDMIEQAESRLGAPSALNNEPKRLWRSSQRALKRKRLSAPRSLLRQRRRVTVSRMRVARAVLAPVASLLQRRLPSPPPQRRSLPIQRLCRSRSPWPKRIRTSPRPVVAVARARRRSQLPSVKVTPPRRSSLNRQSKSRQHRSRAAVVRQPASKLKQKLLPPRRAHPKPRQRLKRRPWSSRSTSMTLPRPSHAPAGGSADRFSFSNRRIEKGAAHTAPFFDPDPLLQRWQTFCPQFPSPPPDRGCARNTDMVCS